MLNCIVRFPLGLSNPISVLWQDMHGPVIEGEGITVYESVRNDTSLTLVLKFNPLHTSHEGHFVCEASLESLAPPYTLTTDADLETIVSGKVSSIHF